ncbi:MAG: hypothetical protein ABI921_03495 [Panacibacter sp.]
MKTTVLFFFSALGVVIAKGQDGKQKQPVKSDTVFVKGLIDSPYFITKTACLPLLCRRAGILQLQGLKEKSEETLLLTKAFF